MEQNTTSVVIEQQGENKKRGALAVILAVAFVAMLGIGSTFAYMQWTGNQTPNRFTVDKGLTADVVEPAWTTALSKSTAGYPNVASDGTTNIPEDANNFGGVAAADATAVTKVAKDPYVVNTSMVGNESTAGSDAYVGIRLTFQKWVAESVTGYGDEHRETGKYVTMTQDEVDQFFKCYTLNKDGATSTYADADKGKSYGYTIGDGWTQYVEGTAKSQISPQMYFVYNQALKSVGSEITGNYPEAQASAAAGKTTTTNLFNYVQLVDNGDTLTKFVNYLKTGKEGYNDGANATTDPGFRILVDTAAVDAPTGATSISGDRLSALSSSTIYPAVNESGASPTANSYWNGDTESNQGSGYGTNAANVPESKWNY